MRSRSDVGRSLTAIGVLLESTGKTDQAVAAYREAERRLAAPAGPGPGAAVRAALAACRSRLGWLLKETGHTADALAIFRLARADQEVLAGAAGATDGARNDLATTVNRLGVVLTETGKAGGGRGRVPRGAGDPTSAGPTTTPPSPTSAAAWRRATTTSASCWRRRASRRRRRPSTARRWRSSRSWPTTIPPSPSSAAGWRSATTTSAICWRRRASRRRRRPSTARRWRSSRSWPTTTPPSPISVSAWRSSHINLGDSAVGTGKAPEAEAEYRQALAIQQKLADDNPAVTEFRSSWPTATTTSASCWRETGKASEAEAEYREALAIQRKLADDNPAVTDFRSRLAHSHHNLGDLLSLTGKASEAEAEYRAALAIQRKLADDNPAVTDFRSSLAAPTTTSASCSCRRASRRRPRPSTAQRWRSIRSWPRPTPPSHPTGPVWPTPRLTWPPPTCRWAATPRPGRRPSRPWRCWRHCSSGSPGQSSYRAVLGEALLRRGQARLAGGDPAGAASDWRADGGHLRENAAGSPNGLPRGVLPRDAGGRGRSGRLRVPAGEGPIEAGRAMDILRRAVAMGFRSADRYRVEPALGPLRDREDFRLLMMDLAMPDRPVRAVSTAGPCRCARGWYYLKMTGVRSGFRRPNDDGPLRERW